MKGMKHKMVTLYVYIYLTFWERQNKEKEIRGAWVAQLVEQLPSAQVMILDFQDRVPHRAPSSLGSLLLPLTFSSLMLSLTHSPSNK